MSDLSYKAIFVPTRFSRYKVERVEVGPQKWEEVFGAGRVVEITMVYYKNKLTGKVHMRYGVGDLSGLFGEVDGE